MGYLDGRQIWQTTKNYFWVKDKVIKVKSPPGGYSAILQGSTPDWGTAFPQGAAVVAVPLSPTRMRAMLPIHLRLHSPQHSGWPRVKVKLGLPESKSEWANDSNKKGGEGEENRIKTASLKYMGKGDCTNHSNKDDSFTWHLTSFYVFHHSLAYKCLISTTGS